mgnify:CR=1 FL=1
MDSNDWSSYMSRPTIDELLKNNVVPLSFEEVGKNQKESLADDKLYLGNGNIIGTLGKYVLVLTARHLFDPLKPECISKGSMCIKFFY